MRACRRRTTLFWCYVNGFAVPCSGVSTRLLALNLTIFAGSCTNTFLKGKGNWHFSWNSVSDLSTIIFFKSAIHHEKCKGEHHRPTQFQNCNFFMKTSFSLWTKAHVSKTTLGQIRFCKKWLKETARYNTSSCNFVIFKKDKRLDLSLKFNYSEFPLTSNFPLIKSRTN